MTEPHSAFTVAQRDELKKIVTEAMNGYFEDKGVTAKQWLVTAAIIVTAVTSIIVGLKFILSFLGFHYIPK